jgi:hypothetical protein
LPRKFVFSLLPHFSIKLLGGQYGLVWGSDKSVNFQIANPSALLSSGNAAISTIAGPAFSTGLFDWGLPFFFGRTVYVGLGGKPSVLGTGPYWAY